MFYTLKIKKSGFKLLLAAIIIALCVTLFFIFRAEKKDVFARENVCPSLVIDPGHGGVDGGAIALNGAKESDINLAIGLRLEKLAAFCGVHTVMTRTDDNMRTDMDSYSEHDELVRRTDITNSTPSACLISIHQNFYPTSQPSGAQVLYAGTSGSREFGELTHKNIIDKLQPENRRVAGPAAKELYITSHINCPGILVECGFMSNFSDLEKLSQKEYQNTFALVLLGSYLQYKNAYS